MPPATTLVSGGVARMRFMGGSFPVDVRMRGVACPGASRCLSERRVVGGGAVACFGAPRGFGVACRSVGLPGCQFGAGGDDAVGDVVCPALAEDGRGGFERFAGYDG